MQAEEIATEVELVLKYRSENSGIVECMARFMNRSKWTVYDYLNRRIQWFKDIATGLTFLHAAVVATGGDPDIKKHLEPPGWKLVKDDLSVSDADTLEREILDNHPRTVAFEQALLAPRENADRKARRRDLKQKLDAVIDGFRRDYVKWCHENDIEP